MRMSYSIQEEGETRHGLPIFPPSDRTMSLGQGSLFDKKQQFNILEKLKQLRDNKVYCDVILVVRGVRLEAHKNVLAAWSPYFAGKLFPGASEVFKDTIYVNYDSSEVFADLLDFMYNGYVAPRETNFLELLHLAVSFQIEMLKNYCEEFLRCNLHLGNFVSTYFLSRKYKLDSLEEYIVGFLQLNLSDAVKQGEFLSLTARKFNTLLSKGWMEQIKPEIKLFLIISWVGYDVQEREKFLVLLLGHIDWSAVANDFLLEISRTENFFTSHESSLYLLLQTLYSAGIPIGPYTETFPSLREAHEHILNEVVDTSLLQIEVEEFFPATIVVVGRPGHKDKCINTSPVKERDEMHVEVREACINTDVNSEHFEKEAIEAKGSTILIEPYHEEQETEHHEVVGTLMIDSNAQEFDEVGKYIEAELDEMNRRSMEQVAKENTETANFNQTDIPNTSTPRRKSTRQRKSLRRGTAKKTRKTKIKEEEKDSEQVVDHDNKENNEKEMKNVENNSPNVCDEVDVAVNKQQENGEKEVADVESDIEETDDNVADKTYNPQCKEEETENGMIKLKKSFHNYQKNRKRKSDILSCSEPDCKYKTKIKKRMDKHVERVHEQAVEFKCTICLFTTKCVRTFNNHMKKHIPGPPYKCDGPRCSYAHEKMSVLLNHRACHSDERPFACSCGMRFKSNNTLLQHKKTHSGIKNHECPVCKVCFATKNTMLQHLVRHDESRPYLCDKCGFSTKFQSHLTAHKRIHTGDVFYCQFPNCQYFTPKRSQLKSHMKFHLRIRSHTCQECGKSFIERSHLVRHEKIHSDQKIKCEECDYTTTRRDKLKEHKAKHHSEEARLKREKKEAAKLKSTTARTEAQKTIVSNPVVVKWDHGGYSIPPNEDPGGVFQGGNSAILVGDNYCVLRDQLTSSDPIQPPLIQTVMSDPSMTPQTHLTDISSCQPDMDHSGPLHHDPSMDMVSSPGMDHVHSSGVTSGLDVNSIHESHNYATISSVAPMSQQQTSEYNGGLGAFMALF